MSEHDLPDLSISDEKLCFIIAKAREFDVKDVVTDPDDASNPTETRCSRCWRITRTIRSCRSSSR
jgi:hypothetical protein